MIKGIFFDVGGTLCSYRNLPATMTALMESLALRLELEYDVADLMRHYNLATQEVDRVVAGEPFYLFRDYFAAIFASFVSRIGMPHLRHHFAWFEEHQREKLIDCLEVKPDCHSTLARLKEMGLYLSAASNADDNILEPLIERGRLQRWLTHWTSSEAARSCKPDRRFFEVALEKSGLCADQVLFVGDSPEQDILGAHSMGMATVLIAESARPAPMHVGRETPEPDFRIGSLSSLPEIVAGLGAAADGVSGSDR